jgi:hypothetical protein
LQLGEGADQKQRARQQDQRQRDLRGAEQIPQPRAEAPGRRAASRRLQQLSGVAASQQVHRRRGARKQARQDHGGCREGEHARVQLDGHPARQRDSDRRAQRAHPPPGEPAAEDAARRGQRQALDGRLPDQLGASRAESEAHRRLPAARERARQQQVRGVAARHQQHEKDGAEHDEQVGPHVARVQLAEGDGTQREPGVRVGELLREPARDAVQLRLQARDAVRAPDARDPHDIAKVALVVAREAADRPVHLDLPREIEAARRDAVDLVTRRVIERDLAADHVRAAAEVRLPSAVAEDDAVVPLAIRDLRPAVAQLQRRAEDAEQVPRAEHGPPLPRPPLAAVVVPAEAAGVRGDLLEARNLLADVEDLAHRQLAGLAAAQRVDLDELVGVLERKRPDQQRVHEAEDRGVGADRERERGDDGRGDPRLPAHLPQRVTNVPAESLDRVHEWRLHRARSLLPSLQALCSPAEPRSDERSKRALELSKICARNRPGAADLRERRRLAALRPLTIRGGPFAVEDQPSIEIGV